MQVKDLIRQIGDREPLNPYQVAGMASVLNQSGLEFEGVNALEVEGLTTVLMVLDRTGEEASPYLIDLRQTDSHITLFPRFSRESLEDLVYLTSFEGRRLAIRENLIPILYEIPNWLDLVRTLSRYVLDRDDEALSNRLPRVMEIVLSYLFAAARQPFDREARSEGEYAISRLVESVLKSADEGSLEVYLPFVERCLGFLTAELFGAPVNPFERRILEIFSIRGALKRRSEEVKARLSPYLNRMSAAALITALGEIQPSPRAPVEKLTRIVAEEDFAEKERFSEKILARIGLHSHDAIETMRNAYRTILENGASAEEGEIRRGIEFIRSLGDEWREILASFQEMIDELPPRVQEAFCEVLAFQILAIDKPEIKELLIGGVCEIVVRLESTRKQASKKLVDRFAELFLDRAYASEDTTEVVSSLKSLESLGVTLGRNGYHLMAFDFVDHLVRRPLISPREKRYTIEDDDTGEPLVIAEDPRENQAHVQHIKSFLAIVASNPRIMRRLMSYLIIQIELGDTRLCDEDLIQCWISSLLNANSSITHFLTRTLIKAIPYSFKDIGPLDNLRLTAAGLAKLLANRGVKPIGNFLGKLRGDIHWRGSIENFYFCLSIVHYFLTGRTQDLAEWMPSESMPYLRMEEWASPEEAAGIRSLLHRILDDYKIDSSQRNSLQDLIVVDTDRYRGDEAWPEFSRRAVLDVVELLKGLHTKYFIVADSTSGATASEELEEFSSIIAERGEIKETALTPDRHEPLPPPVTLTEGSEDYVAEMERIHREQPGTPIVLRAKKAGHAYAQKATYIEERFEAFNKDLALESLQETLATGISNTHFNDITLENLPDALCFLDSLIQGISVNGHSSYYLEQVGKDLRSAGGLGLTFDKVRDLLRVIHSELEDVYDFYRAWFEEPFDQCLSNCAIEKLPRKLKALTTLKEIPDSDFFNNYLKTLYISDLQARDGNLRVLEGFIDKVELFLNQRLAESGRRVVQADAARTLDVPFYFPEQGEMSACRIGQKASLLHFAENTPPYFVITTAQPLKELEAMLVDSTFRDGLTSAVQELERRCGRSFGDPSDPALFSVRSGARLSLPGMMMTITNVGINDEIAAALAGKVDSWFAYDCYRRFLQEFGQSVFGVEREEFQDIIDERKVRWRVNFKAEMSGGQMRQLAFDYKIRLRELAPEAIELLDQGRFLDLLTYCAMAVLHSYDGRAARQYREAAGIDGDWRTPAIVQAMVYGNMEYDSSGTGVVSYNPFTLDLRGDFAHRDQGTDVVGGKVATIPVYDPWKRTESLASQMPDGWKQLSSFLFRTAERLHLPVSTEYTIEKGRVFVLQIRKHRERLERVPSLEASGYRVIEQGTGISGTVFRGIMVTDRNQIAPFRHIAKAQSIIDAMNKNLSEGEKLDGFIFIVNDPIPEEIMEGVFSLPVSTALVSRLGGRGAHAADIARSLRKVYVAQVRGIAKFSGKPESVRFSDEEIVVGSKMIIHGQTGEIALYGKTAEHSGD
ncbi:MAG: PEP/pyruvate-binding domain-containing protein [Deltaproteobacteria bacterium]